MSDLRRSALNGGFVWSQRQNKFHPMLKLFFIACALSIPLSAQKTSDRPIETSITELSEHAKEFDGDLVLVPAVLVFGWEGDNFLLDPSKPAPLDMPSLDPASVWFHSRPDREPRIFGAIGQARIVYGTFQGYFHFVAKQQIVNSVFDPGPLQFEAVEVFIPDKPPQSLALASYQRDVDEIRKILHSDPKIGERYGSLLLFVAADTDRADFVRELLSSGADPKLTMPDGSTSLTKAAFNCRLEVAKSLLDGGASPNSANALMFASHNCPDGKMVQLLLDAGANPKATVNEAALMAAAGNPRVVEKLLTAGADPAFKDKYGNTVESESCDRGEKGHYEVCQLVREALRRSKP